MDKQLAPIYTVSNCTFAYQLRWGITLFWKNPPEKSDWIELLSSTLESKDRIRILDHRWASPKQLQFSISTLPDTSPVFVIQKLKGRLVYQLEADDRKLLEPTYAIRSFGSQNREVVEGYVTSQWQHHPMAAERIDKLFRGLSYENPIVDLSKKQKTHQGAYWYNLHIVLVHVERWRDVNQSRLESVLAMVQRVARKHGCRLSKCSILADHLHLAIGCLIQNKPVDVALSFLNNLAFVYDMKAVYKSGAFIGTFGEYDQRSVVGDQKSQ